MQAVRAPLSYGLDCIDRRFEVLDDLRLDQMRSLIWVG